VRVFGPAVPPQTSVDEAQVKGYYDANPAEFRSPSRVRRRVRVLSADSLARQDPGHRRGS